jgi:hypothetical protein
MYLANRSFYGFQVKTSETDKPWLGLSEYIGYDKNDRLDRVIRLRLSLNIDNKYDI